ncbi:hypothetical protein, partial [Nostocoides jenkinsii]|uniref:hypothetical protein n=1 Tax=Nostocoides jenkinsii TaxID=330834 RepID=UPI00065BEBE8
MARTGSRRRPAGRGRRRSLCRRLLLPDVGELGREGIRVGLQVNEPLLLLGCFGVKLVRRRRLLGDQRLQLGLCGFGLPLSGLGRRCGSFGLALELGNLVAGRLESSLLGRQIGSRGGELLDGSLLNVRDVVGHRHPVGQILRVAGSQGERERAHPLLLIELGRESVHLVTGVGQLGGRCLQVIIGLRLGGPSRLQVGD